MAGAASLAPSFVRSACVAYGSAEAEIIPIADEVPNESSWFAVPAAPTLAVQATRTPDAEGTVVKVEAVANAEHALTEVSAT